MIKQKQIVSSIFSGVLIAAALFQNAFAQTAIPPEEVQNLTAVPSSESVTLSWDSASDEDGIIVGYKIYYGTYSVQNEGDAYDDSITTDVTNNFTVTDLIPEKEYFFAITALDDEENESETYSAEVSATVDPTEKSPVVVSVTQESNEKVIMTFSEPVKIEGGPSAFFFEEIGTRREIPVSEAIINETNVELIISKDLLDIDQVYLITATSKVKNMDDRPIRAGIQDSAEFTARFFEPAAVEEPVIMPEVVEEPMPEEQIVTPEQPIPEPEETIPKETDDELFSAFLDDIEEIPEEIGLPEAQAAAPIIDTTPPLDAMNLVINSNDLDSKNLVYLTWEPSMDLDDDIADQILFIRTSVGSWEDGISIGKDTQEIEIDVSLDTNYQVKIITIDQSGNESEGSVLSFSTNLTKTGPGGRVIALLAASLVVLFFVASSRRTT